VVRVGFQLELMLPLELMFLSSYPNPSLALAHIPVVSIGGGFRDSLIEPKLVVLDDVPATNAISVLTRSIPHVNVTVDHQVN